MVCSHDGKKAQAVIQDLIQKQEYKKVKKELSDWKDDDIKKFDDSVTFTFDQEERDADYLPLEEIEEVDDIDEREKNETIHVDFNYDDGDDEGDSNNQIDAEIKSKTKCKLSEVKIYDQDLSNNIINNAIISSESVEELNRESLEKIKRKYVKTQEFFDCNPLLKIDNI